MSRSVFEHWYTEPIPSDVSGQGRFIHCDSEVGRLRIATLPAFPEAAVHAVGVISQEVKRRRAAAAYAAKY